MSPFGETAEPSVARAQMFARERWGTCDMGVGNTSKPDYTQRCNQPAEYVQTHEDDEGNHPRYCASCARAV